MKTKLMVYLLGLDPFKFALCIFNLCSALYVQELSHFTTVNQSMYVSSHSCCVHLLIS